MSVRMIASRYRVVRELGRGGMGVVYVVEHIHTGEKLALKLLHGSAAANPDVIARFKREARAAAQIKSEHVVRVTDADVAPELDGAPFFVMELLEGFDLERALEKCGQLSSEAVIEILSQVSVALEKAHAIGIVHRDLKPENVFLHRRETGTPIAKVLDFGISKFGSAQDTTAIRTTADGTLMGTPAYMAPEQARGQVEAMGPATDIWSIGLIALRLLTADAYWTAESQAELMVQILVSPMPRPTERWPWLGQRFDEWFARSCDRNTNGRWSSVSEQVSALRSVFADERVPNGASMALVEETLRDLATSYATVPSSEAALPKGLRRANDEPSASPWLPRATTGGAESVTVKPSLHRRRSGVWIVLSSVVAVTLGIAAFAPRLLQKQRATPTESSGSGRDGRAPSESPTGALAVAPPIVDTSPAVHVDAGSDAATSPPSPTNSARPTRRPVPHPQPPRVPAAHPSANPDVPKAPAPERDPMAP